MIGGVGVGVRFIGPETFGDESIAEIGKEAALISSTNECPDRDDDETIGFWWNIQRDDGEDEIDWYEGWFTGVFSGGNEKPVWELVETNEWIDKYVLV